MAFLEQLKRLFTGRAPAPAAPAGNRLGARTLDYLQRTPEAGIEVRRLVDLLLADAAQVAASDVHLDPFEDHVLARFRIDGILYDVAKIPAALKGPLANRVKVMADLKIHLQRVPQDGKARAPEELGGFELRVAVSPMVGGEKISLRLFRPGERRFEPGALGFDAETLAQFLSVVEQPNGLLLLAGPVGSGKTTTLYTALTHLARTRGERLNLTTVEDPVECTLPRVNQASVNAAQGFTYPVALRSILRHDPQVIMIGEIRDEETAGIAIRAALSGHLVMSTVHSATAAGAFARITNLKVDPPLLASATLGVLNLRLVRINCPACATPYEPDASLVAKLSADEVAHAYFRKGSGCAGCGFTGFRGRAPLTEFLRMNPALEKAVAHNATTGEIEQLALASGMKPLAHSARQRAFAGTTTLEEVAAYLA